VKEFDSVRVRRLLGPVLRPHIGDRPPVVGDDGIILGISRRQGTCTVRSTADDGSLIWLADFLVEELEFISSPPPLTA
jgi:hypothetical protein